MRKIKKFVTISEDGIELFESIEDAKESAEEWLAVYREIALSGEWPFEAEHIYVCQVMARSAVTFEGEYGGIDLELCPSDEVSYSNDFDFPVSKRFRRS